MKKKIISLLCVSALLLPALSGCQRSGPNGAGTYTPGTYTGSAQGYGGTVTAEITVDANAITDVKLTGDSETPTVGGAALPGLADQVKEKGADIDGVSGATYTSNGVKEAVAAALAQAKG